MTFQVRCACATGRRAPCLKSKTMTRKKPGKPPFGPNGAPPLPTGTMCLHPPVAFVDAWVWAVFVTRGLDIRHAFTAARETASCIAPIANRVSVSALYALGDPIAMSMLRIERTIWCSPESHSPTFKPLRNVVRQVRHPYVHVYVHNTSDLDIVVPLTTSAGFGLLCVRNHDISSNQPIHCATLDMVYAYIHTTSLTPIVFVCSVCA